MNAPVVRAIRGLVTPVMTALVVGTALCIVNDAFVTTSARRIALNYVVPFLVSAYSRWSLLRSIERAKRPDP